MKRQNVLRSAAIVGVCTTLSRVLGLVRQVIMAAMFGTSLVQSAFVIAFRIPNLFRRLFGEGALSAAFVPVFTESLQKDGPAKAWRLASAVFTLMTMILGGIVVVVLVGTGLSLHWLRLGERATVILSLLQIMFPYMLLICLVGLCMAILNSFHHFFVPAFTPVLLNVVWILVMLLICPRLGPAADGRIYVVAWGVLAAGVLQLLVQFPALRHYGGPFRPVFQWRQDRVLRVLLLMGPAALGMGVIQLNVLVDSVLALLVGQWAPAALSFAELLVYTPLGICATALGTVLLPTFSHQAAQSQADEIKRTLNRSLRALLFTMVPAAMGLVVLSHQVVQLVYEWRGGEFGAESTLQTARALMFYAPGLVVFGLYKVLVPVFYALQDTRTPVRVAVRMVALNFLLNVTFILTWPEGFKHAGLACATVLSSGVNAVMLSWHLHRRIGSPGWRQILSSAARSLTAGLIMAVAVWAWHPLALRGCVRLAGVSLKSAQFLAMSLTILAGGLVYTAAALVLSRAELKDVYRGLRRRAARTSSPA